MSENKEEHAVVPPYILWLLLLCSLRYAMGRSSVVVSEISDTLNEYFRVLSRHQQLQIIKEIDEEVERADRLGVTLGDQMDHELWIATARRLEQKVKHDSQ